MNDRIKRKKIKRKQKQSLTFLLMKVINKMNLN